MFNKDLYIKTFEVLRKEYEKEIKLKNKIIEECLRIGNLKICKCEKKNCEALWIKGIGNAFINAELCGVCDCGKVLCINHSHYLIDDYENERFLCEICFNARKKRIEESRIKWEDDEKKK
jgi:hypothetical protein